MRLIKDMSILEIDITNACMNGCSNCTRFCGHHKKPYFMDFDTFKRAVDSLEKFAGLISVMGGEPLLHPEFERFAAYLEEKRTTKALHDHKSKAIVKDYLAYAQAQRWFNNSYNKGAGYNIFTSIPANFYQHYERIHDTFTHMFLNDHTHPSFHQPILISRKDLGINDEDFAVMREQCWLQNFWSASITPKGAFFCEIAGTLDMLLDGPGGWKIEPAWWKRDISDFKEQFHYCDLCGMALKTFSRNANDEMDDASVTLYNKLKNLDTPRFRQKRVQLYQPEQVLKKDEDRFGADMNSVTANYEPDYYKRVGTAAMNLRPKRIIGLITIQSVNQLENTDDTLDKFDTIVDLFYIVTNQDLLCRINAAYSERENCKILCTNFAANSFGNMMNVAIQSADNHDWLLLLACNAGLSDDFHGLICERYLNPGYLFKCLYDDKPVYMFNKLASAIRKNGFDGIGQCKSMASFIDLWQDKTYTIKPGFEEESDLDINYFRKCIYDQYAQDKVFFHLLEHELSSKVKGGKTILVTHSAFIYHTTSIVRLVENLGYDVRVLASRRFSAHFQDWLDDDKVFYFDEGLFVFDKLKPLLNKIKEKISFSGALIPFFPGAGTVKPIDAYTDVLKSAAYVSRNIVGIINVRREFVTVEYDYWENK